MYVNSHAHIFTLRTVLSREAISVMIQRLNDQRVPPLIVAAVRRVLERLAPLRRWLELEVDAAYFFGFGMDDVVAAAGLDHGAFIAADLGVVVSRSMGDVRLERIFVGYARGQQPTGDRDRKA
jgi:hypothetical protein